MTTNHKTIQQLVTAAFAAAWIAAPPFIEGTAKGWIPVQHNVKSFAEQTHEPTLAALHHVAYLATAAATHANLSATNAPNVAAVVASILIWVVIVTRTAAATHASDGTHSIVIVPWTSSIAGIATAIIPQTFKIVNALTRS